MSIFKNRNLILLEKTIKEGGDALSQQIHDFKNLPEQEKKFKIRLFLNCLVVSLIITSLLSLSGCSTLPQDVQIDGLSITTSRDVPLLKPTIKRANHEN